MLTSIETRRNAYRARATRLSCGLSGKCRQPLPGMRAHALAHRPDPGRMRVLRNRTAAERILSPGGDELVPSDAPASRLGQRRVETSAGPARRTSGAGAPNLLQPALISQYICAMRSVAAFRSPRRACYSGRHLPLPARRVSTWSTAPGPTSPRCRSAASAPRPGSRSPPLRQPARGLKSILPIPIARSTSARPWPAGQARRGAGSIFAK